LSPKGFAGAEDADRRLAAPAVADGSSQPPYSESATVSHCGMATLKRRIQPAIDYQVEAIGPSCRGWIIRRTGQLAQVRADIIIAL
jgi:hypothetical protein